MELILTGLILNIHTSEYQVGSQSFHHLHTLIIHIAHSYYSKDLKNKQRAITQKAIDQGL